jgi:membrane associated rhomboid family serine protease
MSLTLLIIIVTFAVSALAFQNRSIMERYIFNPYIIDQKKEWFRFVSSGFLHADWIHLLVNMFVLFSFGYALETYFDELFNEKAEVYFVLLYVGGLMTSVLPTYRKQKNNPSYNALGASGAVSAVVFAFILLNPLHELCLYGVLCLPGIIFGVLYLFYCYYMGKKGQGNINHDAHLWGALYGFFFTILLKPSLLPAFIQQIIHTTDAL